MPSTQDFLQVAQIKEGVLILKSKAIRGILMVSSLNFALKSNEEQRATIYQFQNFLNTLDFSCQILVQSRRLNMTGYIEHLKDLEKEQREELLKVQTVEYRKFIETLLAQGIIMSKKFFVVIPFNIWESESQQAKTTPFKRPKVPTLTEENFQRCKSQLWQRMEFVAMGLRRCGLQTIPLRTSEIIELIWGLYHPGRAEVGYYPEIPPELIK